MNDKRDKDVAARLQDLLKLRKRTGMADAMFFSTMVELASECGVESMLAVTPKEVKASFAEWLPQNVDELVFVPSVSSEKDKALRETMKLLKRHCCATTG